MRRFALGLGVLCTLAFACTSAFAQTPIYDCYNGSSEQGGNRLTVNGIQTSQYAQQSYPAASVTIYIHNTLTLATNMTKDDAGVQPLSNPFVSTAHGVAFICGPDGRYDLQYSGTGISVPFTVSDVHLCFACSGGGGGGGVNLTPYQVARADATGHTLQDSTGSDNPSNGPTRWSQGLSVEGNAGYRFFVNSTAGTTLNLLVCRDTSIVSMTQVTTCPVSSNSVFGLADNGAGVTGNVRVAMIGFHPCVFDNRTIIGDWAIPSATTAGECSDAGATKPTTQQVLGHVTTLNTGADTLATVDLWTGDTISGGGATVAIGPCAGTNCNAYYPTTNSIAGDVSVTDDGVGNMTMKSAGMTDTTQSGFWYQVAGPALPTLTGLHRFFFGINPSFGTTFGLEPWDSAPTVGNCMDIAAGDSAGWIKLHDSGNPCGTGGSIASTYRTCTLIYGADNGGGLVNADIGPQGRQCILPYNATISQVEVSADAGTPSVMLAVNHQGVDSNILSSALATASSGGVACSTAAGGLGFDGVTTCSSTLQNTSAVQGDYIEAVSGTASPAKRISIFITFTQPNFTTGGTVTSVGLTVNGSASSGILSASGSPVLTAGNLNFATAGTSGGIPYFSSSTVLSSSAALTVNLPVIGGGAGSPPTVGTVTGNTTKFATSTGSLTSGNCIKSDASGNLIDAATTCGGGGGASTGPVFQALLCSTNGLSCATSATGVGLAAGVDIFVLCTYNTTSGGIGTPSISDTAALTWTNIATASFVNYSGSSSLAAVAYWATTGATTGADTFTCASTGTGVGFSGITAFSVLGASTSSPIDGTPATAGANAIFSINTTTTSANDLLITNEMFSGSAVSVVPSNISGGGAGTGAGVGGLWQPIAWFNNIQALMRPAGPAGKYYFQGVAGNSAELLFAIH